MLPALRQDLSLHAGPAAEDGSPTWTLHDPAANRFYRLGWTAFEMLSRWPLGEPQALLDAVNRETALRVDGHDFLSLLEFLTQHHLIDALGPADTARLTKAVQAGRLSKSKWLLKNYLFFRLPLFRPMAFLNRFSPFVAWAFAPQFWIGIGAVGLLGLYLVSHQWDKFVHTFSDYTSLSGLLAVGIALSFAKVLHEMGHAFAAQHYGCRVPTMGVAFLVMWPVLYTDTNDAWKLPDKRQRLVIAAAGMLSELALAAAATLLWNFMPDGPLRAGAFLLATTTWIITLAINASPFMRFDGYFLLSDWLDMPNLHSRAFAFGRWWLREQLFGWNDAVPEKVTPRRQRFLIVFALITWIYRLILFLGIAFLVYQTFFKLLGIFLMCVELGWFILLPLYSEMKVWWKRRHALRWNRATRRSAIALGALFAFVLLPWQNNVRAPSVLAATQSQGLYAVAAAHVLEPAVKVGTPVRAGQVLVKLESPDLTYRLAQIEARTKLLRWQMNQQPLDKQLMNEGMVLKERWAAAEEERMGLVEQMKQLVVRAPFDGRVVEANEALVPGAWLAKKEKLFHLIGSGGAKGEAFIGETELKHVEAGSKVTFVADMPEQPRFECRLAAVDRVNLATMDSLYMASIYGGPILVQRDETGALVPTDAVFRVRLEVCGDGEEPVSELRGTAHLEGEWKSIAGTYLRRAIAVLQREMGL